MNRPYVLPPDVCIDHPMDKLEPIHDAVALSWTLAGEGMRWILQWTMQGGIEQRSLRLHLVALSLCPQLLPCKHPSASWCARIHGVSRQWASRLQQEFSHQLGDHIRFRGQRFALKRATI